MAGNGDGLGHGCITVSSDIGLELSCAHSGHLGLLDDVVSIWPICLFSPLPDELSGRESLQDPRSGDVGI